MELALFTEEQGKQTNEGLPYSSHRIDPLIEPWINNNKITNQALPFKKVEPGRLIEKSFSERKKTLDERIQEMYRKYSKDDIPNNHINSRQVYRQMLKEFEIAQQFKQIGPKRQKSKQQIEHEHEPIILQIANQRNIVNTCELQEPPSIPLPKKAKVEDKCTDKFQRMLKIREKVRKKNSVAVSKLKEKYLSEYNPSLPYSRRQGEGLNNAVVDHSKAKMKIRIRNQSKSKNTLEELNPKDQFKIVGVYTNALQYAIKRNLNYSSNGGRASKLGTLELNQTFHSFKH